MKYVAASLAMVCALLGYAWQGERAAHANTKTEHAQRLRGLAEQAALVEAKNRQIQKELSDATIEHAHKVDGLLAAGRRLAVRNAGDAERLRNEAAAFASSARCEDSTITAYITPSPSAAVVLADLLGRADARAGDLAQALDESRTRGFACEADYDRAVRD